MISNNLSMCALCTSLACSVGYECGEYKKKMGLNKFTKELNLIRRQGTTRGVDWDLLDEYIGRYLKPCSKEALKELNDKEKQLKEFWMEIVLAMKPSNKEVIRVSAWFINKFKRVK